MIDRKHYHTVEKNNKQTSHYVNSEIQYNYNLYKTTSFFSSKL